jgi:hypothetical protein
MLFLKDRADQKVWTSGCFIMSCFTDGEKLYTDESSTPSSTFKNGNEQPGSKNNELKIGSKSLTD